MSEPQVEKFTLSLKLDATISVIGPDGQATDWLKPGVEAAATWKGGIPSEAELKLGASHIHQRVLAPTLEELVVSIRDRLVEVRRGG